MPSAAASVPVSVIIPARNASATIGRTLESLVAQTTPDWEAIVVENGSSDDTAAVAERWAERDPRIRVVRSDASGVSAARNEGIARAAHDRLLFLDADDWLDPDALAAHGRAMEAAPGADATWSGWVRVFPDGDEYPGDPEWEGDVFPAFARSCLFAIHACVVRRDRVLEVGGFDPALTTCEDWDLWQRLARAGCTFHRFPGRHAYYMTTRGSACADAAGLMRDAATVIGRGHAPDLRVPDPRPEHRDGRPRSERGSALLSLSAFAAAIALTSGQDWRAVLARPDDLGTPPLDVEEVAWHLFAGFLVVSRGGVGELPQVRAAHAEELAELADRLAAPTATPGSGRRILLALDRIALGKLPDDEAIVMGTVQQVPIDLEQPLRDVEPAHDAIERVLLSPRAGERGFWPVELPASGAPIPAAVIADATAALDGWPILGEFFERTVYAAMRAAWDERDGQARRRALRLDDAPSLPPHDEIGWNVFLQELLALPDRHPGIAYESSTRWRRAGKAPLDEDGRAVVEVGDLPLKVPRGTKTAVVTCAGVPVRNLDLGGRRAAGEVTALLLDEFGASLADVVVRQALIGRPWAGTLRDLLSPR